MAAETYLTLFQSGEKGHAFFRIPSLIALPGGRLIAFCEGRVNSLSDHGQINIVQKTSNDNGVSFSPLRIIASDGSNTVGNPCPVYDRQTGLLWLFMNGNPGSATEAKIKLGKGKRRVLAMHSLDLGESWSQPVDLTASLSQKNWGWYACGPCHGIQTSSGRLVIPCNHSVYDEESQTASPYMSHTIYSDDHGQSWHLGANIGLNTNECTVAEVADGLLYANMRSYHGQKRRAVSYSHDLGQSWEPVRLDPALPEPVCQGSVISAEQNKNQGRWRAVYFANPAHEEERKNLTLYKSTDGAASWKLLQIIWPGWAAYNDLALLPQGKIACLFEKGRDYNEIVLYTCPIN